MTSQLDNALNAYLLAWADDELILAHRNSEWTGHGPILEEDIAFSNIAQDELGHATLWYTLYSERTQNNPDQLVFWRDASAFRNVQMAELPNGDWAFSMMRQYLFDMAETVRLTHLLNSSLEGIRHIAAKARPEELYHVRHTHLWVKRLGLGTEESHQRTQKALNQLWRFAQQLFVPLADEPQLVDAGFLPASESVYQEWHTLVCNHLQDSGLSIPADQPLTAPRTEHTEHLTSLLIEMQEVARLDPQATW